ncbi:MAG: hypothetical protein ACM357_02400 [Gemmatimonadota bacterium]
MRLLAAFALLPSLAGAQEPWALDSPAEARQTGTFSERRLDESSGLAASRAQHGVLWTLEDSGNPAEVHAVDTAGRMLGSWRIEGARNADWEALSLGPCGTAACLHIADTGDNAARRGEVVIYRIREPVVATRESTRGRMRHRIRSADVLTVRYPDGPHDVEALVVTPDEELLLVSKGRDERVQAFRVGKPAWNAGRTATAEALGVLDLPQGGIADLVTDAALHPDGLTLVIRTYVALYFLRLDDDGIPRAGPKRGCAILGLELQGEGVTWIDESTLALSSEAAYGVPGTLSRVRCPHR